MGGYFKRTKRNDRLQAARAAACAKRSQLVASAQSARRPEPLTISPVRVSEAPRAERLPPPNLHAFQVVNRPYINPWKSAVQAFNLQLHSRTVGVRVVPAKPRSALEVRLAGIKIKLAPPAIDINRPEFTTVATDQQLASFGFANRAEYDDCYSQYTRAMRGVLGDRRGVCDSPKLQAYFNWRNAQMDRARAAFDAAPPAPPLSSYLLELYQRQAEIMGVPDTCTPGFRAHLDGLDESASAAALVALGGATHASTT